MAQHTKFPASPPPAPPERASTSRLLLRGYIILVLAAALGNSAVFHLAGLTGSVIVILVLTAASLAIWIPEIVSARPTPFAWRRLPWAALGYATLAIVSVSWSRWPLATLLTWTLLAFLTAGALFIAHSLTWPEILRALASALKWLLGLSLAIELWVALVLQHPLLPNFVAPADDEIDPNLYWVQGNLIDGGRIQGIVGNANLLAPLCLLAIIVFCALYAARVRWRVTLLLWIAVAAYLLIRTGSVTLLVASLVCAVVLVVALLMRRAEAPRARAGIYAMAFLGGGAAAVAALANIPTLVELVDRDVDFTGRQQIWERVLDRAAESPWAGLGFSSPWVPTEPEIHEWIVDNDIIVFHAHSMWVDARFQLGWIGVVLLAGVYAALLWRAWFFAIDRPRWDLRTDRPYSPLAFAPLLITTMLLVQGITESAPMMMWGWMLAVLLSFKLKSIPLLSTVLSERERMIERGGRRGRAVP